MTGDPEARLRPPALYTDEETCGQYGHAIGGFYGRPDRCFCGSRKARPVDIAGQTGDEL